MPVVWHGGTPGTRWMSRRAIAQMEVAGVRVLFPDRPGYGGSTRQRGRRVVDVAADVDALADAEGWQRFAMVGGSGGGPHALATAASLGARVTACAVVVGVAPYDATGLDWYAGMSPGNVAEFRAAEQGEEVLRPLVERLGLEVLASVESGGLPVADGYDLPESDLEEIQRHVAADDGGLVARTLASEVDGADGWMDDLFAFVRPWGFDPTTVQVPIGLWSGPDDVLVPRGHAEWLRNNLPAPDVHALPGGHAFPVETWQEIYGWFRGVT